MLLAVPVPDEAGFLLPLAQLIADHLRRVVQDQALVESVRLRPVFDTPLHDLFDVAPDLEHLDWDKAAVGHQPHLLLRAREAVQHVAPQLAVHVQDGSLNTLDGQLVRHRLAL